MMSVVPRLNRPCRQQRWHAVRFRRLRSGKHGGDMHMTHNRNIIQKRVSSNSSVACEAKESRIIRDVIKKVACPRDAIGSKLTYPPPGPPLGHRHCP